MKRILRWCGCGVKSIEDMNVDELCEQVHRLEVERDTKVDEIDKLEVEIEREVEEDTEQKGVVDNVKEIYEKKKQEVLNKQNEYNKIEDQYKKVLDELHTIKGEYSKVEEEYTRSNEALCIELEETKQLKQNRQDARNRIMGIDKESENLRRVIDSQIVELSEKINKLEGV